MRVVYKYAIDLEVKMPSQAQIVCVDTQQDKPFIWAVVDTESPEEIRAFRVYGTGESIPDGLRRYIGTYRVGPFVWHVFEVLPS